MEAIDLKLVRPWTPSFLSSDALVCDRTFLNLIEGKLFSFSTSACDQLLIAEAVDQHRICFGMETSPVVILLFLATPSWVRF